MGCVLCEVIENYRSLLQKMISLSSGLAFQRDQSVVCLVFKVYSVCCVLSVVCLKRETIFCKRDL